MGMIDDVKRMKQEGKSDMDVIAILKQRGLQENQAYELISQAQIKEAVSSNEQEASSGEYTAPSGYEEMQPSILEQEPQIQQNYVPQQPSGGYSTVGGTADYGYQGNYSGGEQYQPYQEAMSSDVITEISEQVVNEKLSGIQDKLEKVIDFRTVAEARISTLDERLKRIEQILDRLQLSLLQKVGEYVNDVKDIKKEIVETQTSFKKMASGRGMSSTGKERP